MDIARGCSGQAWRLALERRLEVLIPGTSKIKKRPSAGSMPPAPSHISRVNGESHVHKIASMAGLVFIGLTAPATGVTAQATIPPGERCTALAQRAFEGAAVESADFTPGGVDLNQQGVKSRNGVCRVRARLNPVPGSVIRMEIWLPADWNGKILGVGGSGFNGSLAYAKGALPVPARDGYAALVTDAGHDFNMMAPWALGQPEKIIDFGHRANHLGIVAAKALAASYYGTPAKRAYFHGCSNGGRDALMLAQRYPEDYDAIIAGAPAYNWTATFAMYLHYQQVSRVTPDAATIVPKLGLVHDAAINRCDAADGIKDGLIGNPATCRFDPRVLACKAVDGPNCLTRPEVAAVSSIYRGMRLRNGEVIMPGLPPGSEKDWAGWFAAANSMPPSAAADYYRNMVYGDPKWDAARFLLERDYREATRRVGPILNATNPDLRPFFARGGRLLMYHGWNDAALSANNTIAYFRAMRRTSGKTAADRTRLFMVPGMGHCSGGDGPDTFDALGAIDRWTERGTAPEQLVVAKYENSQAVAWGKQMTPIATRNICAWPKSPYYKGSGPSTDASSFLCR